MSHQSCLVYQATNCIYIKKLYMKLLTVFILVASLFPTGELNSRENPGINQVTEFKTYYNRSRGYKIDYPSFLTMGSGSENADGRTFYSNGRAIQLEVWSRYSEESIKNLYYGDLNNDRYTITYKTLQSSWYVVSGVNLNNGKIFYKKVYYSINESEVRNMILEYPSTRKSQIDPLISRIQKSFSDL
jgi:hypothetical protein